MPYRELCHGVLDEGVKASQAWLSGFSAMRHYTTFGMASCAELCHHAPSHTQLKPSDGVISVIAGDVRAIEGIVQNDQNGNAIQSFAVDVEHVPIVNDPVLPDNYAHAEIHTIPQCPNKSVFRRLSERLALLTSKRRSRKPEIGGIRPQSWNWTLYRNTCSSWVAAISGWNSGRCFVASGIR